MSENTYWKDWLKPEDEELIFRLSDPTSLLRTLLSNDISKSYDSLSDEEIAENRSWGEMAEREFRGTGEEIS